MEPNSWLKVLYCNGLYVVLSVDQQSNPLISSDCSVWILEGLKDSKNENSWQTNVERAKTKMKTRNPIFEIKEAKKTVKILKLKDCSHVSPAVIFLFRCVASRRVPQSNVLCACDSSSQDRSRRITRSRPPYVLQQDPVSNKQTKNCIPSFVILLSALCLGTFVFSIWFLLLSWK